MLKTGAKDILKDCFDRIFFVPLKKLIYDVIRNDLTGAPG